MQVNDKRMAVKFLSVRSSVMSESFTSTPWFGAIIGAGFSASIGWFRGFARRAKPEDLQAVETRLGKRIDDVHASVQSVNNKITDLYRDLLMSKKSDH